MKILIVKLSDAIEDKDSSIHWHHTWERLQMHEQHGYDVQWSFLCLDFHQEEQLIQI